MNVIRNGFNFLIAIFILNIYQIGSILQFKYPTAITLENGNIFVIEENGIHICDKSFTKIIKTMITFDDEDKISTPDKLSIVSLIKRSYIIMSFINYKIYFFDTDGTYLYNASRLITDCNPKYVSLTPYLYTENNKMVKYIIAYFNSDIKLNISYYYFNKNSKTNEAVTTIIEDNLKIRLYDRYKETYYYDEMQYFNFSNQGLSCLLLYDYYYYLFGIKKDFLVCFFMIQTTNNEYFEELVFTINQSGIKKSTNYQHDYVKFNLNSITQIKADGNDNMDKALVCISKSDNISYCYKFELNENEAKFYSPVNFITKCSSNLYGLKVNYLYETKEVVFSCIIYPENGSVQGAIFDTELTTPDCLYKKIINCESIYGHSIIYSSSNKDYFIISDAKCSTSQSESNFMKLISEEGKEENDIIEETDAMDEEPTSSLEERITSTKEISSSDAPNKCPEKCKKCIDSESEEKCTQCNNDKGYFPLSNSEDFIIIDCITNQIKEQKYNNYYFDIETGFYRPCYERCETCNEKGDGKNNNCITCDVGYMLKPDYEESLNCVPKYKYLYYYNQYNQYSMTDDTNCPDEFSLKIIEKNKCIDKCENDNTYRYNYNNVCYKECPNNTLDDDGDLMCKDDPNVCILTETEISVSNETNTTLEIEKIFFNYAKEYNYTNNHVSIIILGNNIITLYKNKSCLSELSISSKVLDISSATVKVKKYYNISEDEELIIGIIKNEYKYESFEVYHPKNGDPLYINQICKNETYSVNKNLEEELSSNSQIDFENLKDMANQDINIIDLSCPFYSDICFHYTSKFNKDVPLKDRVLIYYPNISLCDGECELESIYLKNWTVKCNCPFDEEEKEKSKNSIKDNALYQSQFGEIEELISLANINVMKCYKDIFEYKFFIKSSGNFIVLSIIILHIVMTIIYCRKSFFYINKYIFTITSKYLIYLKLKTNLNEKPHKFNCETIKYSKELSDLDKGKLEGKVIKKNKRKSRLAIQNPEIFKPKKDITDNDSIKNESNNIKIKIDDITTSNNNYINSSSKIRTNEKSKSYMSKAKSSMDLTKYNLNKKNNLENLEILPKNQENINIDIEDYLKTDPNDMDYDEALRRDNRKFFVYYWEKIQTEQILINTFYYHEPLKPRPIKLMLLALQIDLYFFINGLFYNEEYVKKIFDLEKDTLYKKFLRFTDNLFYAFIVGVIINYIIECFFIEEKKIRVTLKREKNNILFLKYEIIQIIKDIQGRYFTFIIICFIISLFTWYHLYCFNNIYPHMQSEWLVFSVLIILCIQVLSLLSSLLETILRFISFRFKSEKLFKLSLLFS